MFRLPTNRPPEHPGELLREEYLPELGLTQQQLADRLHISFRRVNEIVNGKRPVTLDTALRLGRLFGQSPAFWMNLQLAYDLWHAEHGGAPADSATSSRCSRPSAERLFSARHLCRARVRASAVDATANGW